MLHTSEAGKLWILLEIRMSRGLCCGGHRRSSWVVLVQKNGPVVLLGQSNQRRLQVLNFRLADLVVAVEKVDAPDPSLLVRDVILQAVADGISLADVDRLFGSIAHKDVDTGLGEARFLLQKVEELPVEDDAVA